VEQNVEMEVEKRYGAGESVQMVGAAKKKERRPESVKDI